MYIDININLWVHLGKWCRNNLPIQCWSLGVRWKNVTSCSRVTHDPNGTLKQWAILCSLWLNGSLLLNLALRKWHWGIWQYKTTQLHERCNKWYRVPVDHLKGRTQMKTTSTDTDQYHRYLPALHVCVIILIILHRRGNQAYISSSSMSPSSSIGGIAIKPSSMSLFAS